MLELHSITNSSIQVDLGIKFMQYGISERVQHTTTLSCSYKQFPENALSKKRKQFVTYDAAVVKKQTENLIVDGIFASDKG